MLERARCGLSGLPGPSAQPRVEQESAGERDSVHQLEPSVQEMGLSPGHVSHHQDHVQSGQTGVSGHHAPPRVVRDSRHVTGSVRHVNRK